MVTLVYGLFSGHRPAIRSFGKTFKLHRQHRYQRTTWQDGVDSHNVTRTLSNIVLRNELNIETAQERAVRFYKRLHTEHGLNRLYPLISKFPDQNIPQNPCRQLRRNCCCNWLIKF